MSEIDNRRNSKSLKTVSENSPLLGGGKAKKKQTNRAPPPDPDIYEDYPLRKLCTKPVFISCLFIIGIIILKACVDDRPIDAEIGPENIPARVVEDVVLPDSSQTLSAIYNPKKDSYNLLKDPLDKTATARANYHTNVNSNGWNFFEAKALPSSTSHEAYFDSLRTMGFLEGFMSWKQIVDFYPNYYQSIFDSKSPVLCNPDLRIMRFLQDNYDFMQQQSLKHYKTSEYWLVVRGVLAQLDGMLAGFIEGQKSANPEPESAGRRTLSEDLGGNNDGASGLLEQNEKDQALLSLDMTSIDKPSLIHFLLLNGNGDMFTLIEKFADNDKKKNVTFTGVDCSRVGRRMTDLRGADVEEHVYEYGTSVLDRKNAKITGRGQDGYRTDHCSALVKLLPDGSDVVFGHNTWDDYRNMGPRIFKHYIYPKWPMNVPETTKAKCHPQGKACLEHCALREQTPPAHTYFSSSPGWLTSVDDFYTTFTAPPIPAPVDNDANECSCDCGGDVSSGEGDVALLETADDVESAVQEQILGARASAVEGVEEGTKNQVTEAPEATRGGRLAVIETSLEIYSAELYDLIAPTTMLSWVRARTANTLAQSGADWAKRFSYDHSGTYPNQWIIVDFERLVRSEKSTELLPGFLTIMEEMPGMIRSHDQTEHLKTKTYWASYNIPFYSDLSLYSKNTQLCQTQRNVYVFQNETMPGVDAASNTDSENYRLGHANCYSTCARAQLFARLHKDIVDIPSALKVLSHNDFHYDKESFGNPCEEIACREDLQPLDENLNVFGAIDTKVSSVVEADTVYRGPLSPLHDVVAVAKEEPPVTASDNAPYHYDLTPKQLVFPLPVVKPHSEDISISGDTGLGQVESMQSSRSHSSSSDHMYKQPRIFARQGPTHDEKNKPFCWSDFEARHDAWVVRTRGSLEPPTSRRLGEGRMWRKRKPAFRYSHLGQPNCFAYEWQVMPPQ